MDLTSIGVLVAAMVFWGIKWEKKPAHQWLGVAITLVMLILVLDNFFTDWLIGIALRDAFQTFLGPSILIHLRHLDRRKITVWPHTLLPAVNLLLPTLWLLPTDSCLLCFEAPIPTIMAFFNFAVVVGYAGALLIHHFRLRWEKPPLPANRVRWSGALASVFVGFGLIHLIYLFVESLSGVYIGWAWITASILSLGLLVSLLLTGWRTGYLNPQLPKASPAPPPEEQKWLDLFARLDRATREEDLYLNSQLKVDDLAKRLNTNGRYISRAVNVGYGDSVTNYLNDLRLERFKTRIQNGGRHLNIDALALESGFNSKSAFNRFFKQREGMTPSVYREQVI